MSGPTSFINHTSSSESLPRNLRHGIIALPLLSYSIQSVVKLRFPGPASNHQTEAKSYQKFKFLLVEHCIVPNSVLACRGNKFNLFILWVASGSLGLKGINGRKKKKRMPLTPSAMWISMNPGFLRTLLGTEVFFREEGPYMLIHPLIHTKVCDRS